MNIETSAFESESEGMTMAQFATISSIAHREAGLVFPESKSALVSSRLVKRLRELSIEDFNTYCQFVSTPAGKSEIRLMISALTTNISSFFRENHHFEMLKSDVFPSLIQRVKSGERVRIWSAGCSVGMEAYSIAMTLLQAFPEAPNYDIKILASDIDPKVLETGRLALYDARQLAAVPENLRGKYFSSESTESTAKSQASQELRSLVTFRELNLLETWPISGNFDVIFCRNTVIYFDDETQRELWPRFQETLSPGGWLFVGHSERVPDNSGTDFESCGMTIYRRRPR